VTVRDYQASFTDAAVPYLDFTGAAGTYICANSIDTSPLGAYLTEQTAADTQLSGNVNTGRDIGASEAHTWLIIDVIAAATGGTSADFQLITSASSSLSSPVVLYDSTAIVIATLAKGYRIKTNLPTTSTYLQWLGLQVVTVGTMSAGRIIAWIGADAESPISGYASGFAVK
jgi:hypothetical protein